MFYTKIGINLTLILVLFKSMMIRLSGILIFIVDAWHTSIAANEQVFTVTPLVICYLNFALASLASAEMTQQ